MLAQIPIKNGLYCIKHERDVDIAAVATPVVVVTIEKLHCLMDHITLEAAKTLVNRWLVERIKLNQFSKMLNICSFCKYGKSHRKAVRKECEAPRAKKIGDEIYSNIWGPSPVTTLNYMMYRACTRVQY
jgi:hypothetical protein